MTGQMVADACMIVTLLAGTAMIVAFAVLIVAGVVQILRGGL